MAKATKMPYLSCEEFDAKVQALKQPALTPQQDVERVAEVLQYMGDQQHWPSWVSTKEKRRFDKDLIKAIERVDWGLYQDNFVYIPSRFFGYLQECIRRDETVKKEPFLVDIRATRFAKLCSLAYALVADVHPDRRVNLRPRIEAWCGKHIDAQAPTMLGALFEAWSRHDAATGLGQYGALLSALDPQSSRSAPILSNLLLQMEGRANAVDTLEFNFYSSQ